MPVTDAQVERWLREDLGHHDVTNDVPGEASGRLVAKEHGVAAGIDPAARVFGSLGAAVHREVGRGEAVEPGETLLAVAGPTTDLLRGERVAANVVGHASGIATRTWDAVTTAREVDPDVRVAGTRKTTPGLRGVEKRAIAAGGGDTHRLDLSHMVMVKDNHVDVMGIEAAVDRLREAASFATLIEVEVDAVDEAVRAAEAGADAVMFDNCPPDVVEAGVETLADTGHDVVTEASGGIDVDDVPDYAATGVDVISLGWLTHSAPALDVSFRIDDGPTGPD